MNKCAVLFVFMSTAPLAVMAADSHTPAWVNFPGTGKNDNFVDPESITQRGPLLLANILVNFPQAQQVQGKTYRSTILRRAFNCDTRQTTSIDFELFSDLDGKGTQVGRGVNDDAEKSWREAHAGTIGGAILDFVCSHGKPPKSG